CRWGGATVSIIIPLFNKVELTKGCLERLFATTVPTSCEIILVDNASTDETESYAASLGERVRYIRNDKNRGFAAACNQGAALAKAPLILFLNNDTEPLDGWLEPLLAVLANDPSVVAVGSKLLFPDGTIQHAGVVVLEDRLLPDPLVARHIHYQQPADTPEANIPCTFQVLTAASLLVRKEAFDAAGGFDEGYWNGYEDVDLCFTLQQQGGRLVYEPASVLIHHESKSGPERFRRVNDNIQRLHDKWLGTIKPDAIITEKGVVATDAGFLKPYLLMAGGASGETGVVNPLTSMVILTWNQLDCTKECIESIRRHTPEPYEIVFVDNGSTDGTVKWLRQQVKENANYRLIENKRNLGFAKGCNQGIEAATGELILLINNDVVVTAGWLAGLKEVLASAPEIGIVGPMTNNISGPQRVQKVAYEGRNGLDEYAASFRALYRHRRLPLQRIVGFCMLFRRELVQRIGLLDERFGSGNFEDDDFCLRAELAGFRNMVAADVFIHHHGSKSFVGNRLDYGGTIIANRSLYDEKWGGVLSASLEGKQLLALKALRMSAEFHEVWDEEKAVQVLREGIGHLPDDARLRFALAELLLDIGDPTEALVALGEMPDTFRHDRRWLQLTGYAMASQDDLAGGAQILELLKANGVESAFACNLAGIIAHKRGESQAASEHF
ncbi:MAG TPA: glycosyltransferase, partial [Geobacterales bacterium]|nr:glycosyltransferase [Geobacterales bacterium]